MCVCFGGLLLFLFCRVLCSVWGVECGRRGVRRVCVCASGALLCGLLVCGGSKHTSAFTTRRAAVMPVRGMSSRVRPRGSNVRRAERTCAVAFSSPTCADAAAPRLPFVALMHVDLLLHSIVLWTLLLVCCACCPLVTNHPQTKLVSCCPAAWWCAAQPQVPTSCTGVPVDMLHPERQWGDKVEFNNTLINLGQMFVRNFEHFHDGAPAGLWAV